MTDVAPDHVIFDVFSQYGLMDNAGRILTDLSQLLDMTPETSGAYTTLEKLVDDSREVFTVLLKEFYAMKENEGR